jgi:protein-disulfide isomerase
MTKTKFFLLFLSSIGIILLLWLLLYIDTLQKQKNITAALTTVMQQGNIQQTSMQLRKIAMSDHIKGNKNAKITIIEYSDFQCTSCQTIQPTIDKIVQTYGNDIAFVTRHYPLPQHPDAIKEAEAAECAGELGGDSAYWKYSRKVFENSSPIADGIALPLDQLIPFAKDIELDEKKFSDCLKSEKFLSKVTTDTAEAQQAGVTALPAIFIIDKKNHTQLITGNQPYEIYSLVLERELL